MVASSRAGGGGAAVITRRRRIILVRIFGVDHLHARLGLVAELGAIDADRPMGDMAFVQQMRGNLAAHGVHGTGRVSTVVRVVGGR